MSLLATTAKAGGAISGAVGVPAAAVGTYLYVTSLYEVEREVINKDVKLKAEGPTTIDSKHSITISVDSAGQNFSLSNNRVWTCVISLSETSDDSEYTKLGKYIQSHLQTANQDLNDEQRANKEALVKACAKGREVENNGDTITGKLSLSKIGTTPLEFSFKEHKDLDFLLKNYLYEVEKRVISGEVGLTVENVAEGSAKVKVFATDGKKWSSSGEYYWECAITVPSGFTPNKTEWQKKLFKDEITEEKTQKLANNKTLVQKCSENKTGTSTSKKVTTSLTVSTGNSDDTVLSSIFGAQ